MNTLLVIGTLFLTSPEGVVETATKRFPTMDVCKQTTIEIINRAATVLPEHQVEADCRHIEGDKDA